jgi:hypothetical protein
VSCKLCELYEYCFTCFHYVVVVDTITATANKMIADKYIKRANLEYLPSGDNDNVISAVISNSKQMIKIMIPIVVCSSFLVSFVLCTLCMVWCV